MENSGFKYLVANLVLKGELCVVVWRMVQDLLLQHNKVRTPLNRIPYNSVVTAGLVELLNPRRTHRQASLALYQTSRCMRSTTQFEAPGRERMK
jgi:hypothetical protein